MNYYCNMNPKVSVIIPVYNVEKFLPKCLDSLMNQSFRDIEIICFNDASTDSSLTILKEYAAKDSRIQIIDSKINIRQGGGRNAGIRQAKGEYIAFVDSDDFVHRDFIRILYEAAINHNADISSCYYFKYFNNGIEEIRDESKSYIRELYGNDILSNSFTLWTSIYRKNIFYDYDLFFPEQILYEDNAVVLPLHLAANKVIKINQSLYYYRSDNVSTLRSFNNYGFFDRIESSIIFYNNNKRLGFWDKYYEQLSRCFIILFYLNSITGTINNFKPIPFEKIRSIQKRVTDFVPKKRIKEIIKTKNLMTRLYIKISYFPKPIFIFGLNILKALSNLKHGILL